MTSVKTILIGFEELHERDKRKIITYHEYNIVPTIDVILLASGFFCFAKPKSAANKTKTQQD